MMKKYFLFLSAAVFYNFAAYSQMVDVTAQYITNPGFEECEALPTKVVHDNLKNVDVNVVELWSHWNTAKGFDYESNEWKLVEQVKNANGGIVTYGCNIQVGQYATAGEPGPVAGITGEKGLCFCGAAGLVYQQTNEITLPAGIYRFTVNLYARNGQTTNPGPTQQVVNIRTGFMPTGGTEDDLIPAKRNSFQFASNAWDTDVLDIELTQPTTGRFQVSYGSSYFVVVDDVKLEYQGGVVTTALVNAIEKAKTLAELINSSDLLDAIETAESYLSTTEQDDIPVQAEVLYTAMSNALAATTSPVNITSVYLENASFEIGKGEPWEIKRGDVGEPINELSLPYIVGRQVVEFGQSGSNSLSQTIANLPVGVYMLDAKLNQAASLIIGDQTTSCTGGSDALYQRIFAIAQKAEAGDLVVGAKASLGFRIDDFHLYYGKDEASLKEIVLASVKADAQGLLADEQFVNVTGEERDELTAALETSDAVEINTKANVFFRAKDAYDRFVKAAEQASAYNVENYPYAKAETLNLIQALIGNKPVTRAMAQENTTLLSEACNKVIIENAYCEGVEKTDYTEKIDGADAFGTTIASVWTVNNMGLRTMDKKKAWTKRDGTTDNIVYGTAESYYNAGSLATASIQQTINGIPAGSYVLAVTIMAKTDLPVNIRVNNAKVGTFIGTGTITSANWAEKVVSFEKTDDASLTIRLDEAAEVNYKEWYFDNLRLYLLTPEGNGIKDANADSRENRCYNLNGQQVAWPVKGLYIVNGKKIIRK